MKHNILLILVALFAFACNNSQTASSNTREAHAQDDPARVLFILTSHGEKGDTGDSTGFYLSEAAHPWKVLTSHGIIVDFSTIEGGMPPVDGFDLDDPVNREFWENPEIQKALSDAPRPGDIDPSDYDAIHFVGGHGTMWDFPDNGEIANLAAEIYEQGGYVSAICHGPAGLLDIKLSDGSYLVDGKTLTSFTNAEEEAVGLTGVVPFLLEDALKQRGANFIAADNWSDNVQISERLITGQNPQSATTLGEKLASRVK